MYEEMDWEDEVDGTMSDSNSVITMRTEESEPLCEPEPLFVQSGGGIDGIFYIHPWEEGIDSRIPIVTTYISVFHS